MNGVKQMADLKEVKKVAVIGSGIMGSGIAQAFLLGGYETVVLSDINDDALEKSKESIEIVLKALEDEDKFKEYVTTHPFLGHFQNIDFKKLKADHKRVGLIADGLTAQKIMGRLVCETDLAKAVSDVDFVLEAVSERLDIKQAVFQQLGELTPPHTVCASNTSTLPVTEIARLSKRPENAIGMHFHGFTQAFNRLIEIMGGEKTSDAAQSIGQQVGESLPSVGGERLVIRLEKEAAGFIANRIAAPLQIYSTWLLDQAREQGISLEQLHAAGYDLRMGDFIGLDTVVNATKSYHDHISSDFESAQLITELFNEGKLGAKSGQGIFKWDDTGNPIIKDIQLGDKTLKFMRDNTDAELGLAMRMNEACRLLEMGVVKSYGVITELERIGEGHEGIFELGIDKHTEWSEKLDAVAEKIGKSYIRPCEMMRSGKYKDYP